MDSPDSWEGEIQFGGCNLAHTPRLQFLGMLQLLADALFQNFCALLIRGSDNQKELAAIAVFEWWQYGVFVGKNTRPEQLQALMAVPIPIAGRGGKQRGQFDCNQRN